MRKSILRYSYTFIGGTLAGVVLTALFMAANGHLFAYLVSFVVYSDTLKGIIAFLLPVVGGALGMDYSVWMAKLEHNQSSDLTNKYLLVLSNTTFVILFILSLSMLTYSYILSRRKGTGWKGNGLLCMIFAIYVPIVMNLAGRFVLYYQWMSIVPIVIGVALLFEECKSMVVKVCVVVVSLCLTANGLSTKLDFETKDKVATFFGSQNIKTGDVAYLPYSVFFLAHEKRVEGYFPIYPADKIPTPNYIMVSAEDRGAEQTMLKYIGEIGKKHRVTKIAENKEIVMSFYKVDKK